MKHLARVIAVTAVLAGCGGPTVDGVCEKLSDQCEEVPADECTSEGAELEGRASDAGCDGDFDTYLECLDEGGCDWADDCRSAAERLDACVGGLGD